MASTSTAAPAATMETTIGDFDGTTEPPSVPVTFVYADVTHERRVNACLNATGAYDADATAERVAQVGNGVKINIDRGVLLNVPPPPVVEPEATPTADAPA